MRFGEWLPIPVKIPPGVGRILQAEFFAAMAVVQAFDEQRVLDWFLTTKRTVPTGHAALHVDGNFGRLRGIGHAFSTAYREPGGRRRRERPGVLRDRGAERQAC